MRLSTERSVLGVVVAGLFFCLAPAIRADVVFNNFGAGDRYNPGSGWQIGQAGGGSFFEQGDSFRVTGGDFHLREITVAASLRSGPNEYSVGLYKDNGNEPASLLELFHFSNLPPLDLMLHPPLVGTSMLHPLLEEGRAYWLVYSTTDPTLVVANLNSTGDMGGHVIRNNGGAWSFRNDFHAAFRVEGDPVPEPGSFVLLGIGALGILAARIANTSLG